MSDRATRSLPAVPTTPWLKPLPPALRLILNGGVAARNAAARVWGADFSEEACRAVVGGGRATLWLGPDEYLLLEFASQPETQPPAHAALEEILRDMPCALVDISHRQFAIEVSGPHAALILNGGCPLDLDLAKVPIGMCTRTVFAKADIVLWRTRGDAFHLEVWRSFSGYVTGLLWEIAREFDAR
jgi:sarcosine oxidase subunit gamma